MSELLSFRLIAASLAILLGASGAQAQTDVPGTELSAHVGVVSDFRFRGISLSGRDPALQAGIDVNTPTGLFAGAFASTVKDLGGADARLEFYGGYGASANGIDYSVQANSYFHPGASELDFVELMGTAGKQIGPVAVELQAAYSPDRGPGDQDNLYLGAKAEASLIGTPFRFRVRGGRENGGFDNKWDWEAGVVYERDWLAVSAAYVDTNYGAADEAGRLGRAGFVGSITASF